MSINSFFFLMMHLQSPRYGIFTTWRFLVSNQFIASEWKRRKQKWMKGHENHYQQPLAPQNMLCFHDAQIMLCLVSSTRWVTYMHTEMIQKWNRDDKMKIDDTQNELHTSTYLWCFLTFDLFILQNQTQHCT